MRNRNHYGSYRGRSPFRNFLKWLILLLAVVLVLVVAAFFWLQQYAVYDSDGLRLDLPFLHRESDFPSASPPLTYDQGPTPTIVVITPQPAGPEALHALMLPREALTDGTARDRLEAVGGNAALFDMKADDGTLGYVSDLSLAAQAKASAADAALNQAIRALNGTEELYTVARVSCFKDDLLSDADKSLNILTNSGYKWTDPDGLMWSSPTNPQVRQYVAGVCLELAALGFDEILLDNAGYPTEGNLGYIKKGDAYDRDELDRVIALFYEEVKTALADYPDVKLSIVTDQATLETGSNADSGQRTDVMVRYADRLWSSLEPGSAAALSAGLPAPEEGEVPALVSISAVGGSPRDNWAIWPME